MTSPPYPPPTPGQRQGAYRAPPGQVPRSADGRPLGTPHHTLYPKPAALPQHLMPTAVTPPQRVGGATVVVGGTPERPQRVGAATTGAAPTDAKPTRVGAMTVGNQRKPAGATVVHGVVQYPVVQNMDFYETVYHSKPESFWACSKLRFNPWSAESWKPAGVGSYPKVAMPESPVQEFTLEEFQQLRRHESVESAKRQLSELGKDISYRGPGGAIPHNMRRACFVCVNTYEGSDRSLGVGPINDGIVVAANHKVMGYDVFFGIDMHRDAFLLAVRCFLERTRDWLTIYFSGHGSNGYMAFDDDGVRTRELVSCLKESSQGVARTLLLFDCCHSQNIWGIPSDPVKAVDFPANIVFFGASLESETSKQKTMNSSSQGLFTYFFWKNVKENPGITVTNLKPAIDAGVSKYNQHCSMSATRVNLLEMPLFPPNGRTKDDA